ncbi:MAG: SDR family NAD(P)-dependent oxidoreductase [Egibacteraceae bacterium]
MTAGGGTAPAPGGRAQARRGLARAVDVALEGTVVLSFTRVGSAVRSRLDGWTDPAALPGAGRRVVVTGASSGIGHAASATLLAAGAEVLATARDEAKAEHMRATLAADGGREAAGRLDIGVLDLARLSSVEAFADARLADGRPIDALVHNAGALLREREITVDGLERTYQVHVAAPFLLTARLLPLLAAGRVVTVTSGGMYGAKPVAALVDSPDRYRPLVAYARAKRAQVTLTAEWQRRLGGAGPTFHVAHPGWADTPGLAGSLPGFRRAVGPLLRDAGEGADTVVWLALADEPVAEPGRLWHDRRPRNEHRLPVTRPDPGEADALWRRLCRDTGADPLAGT